MMYEDEDEDDEDDERKRIGDGNGPEIWCKQSEGGEGDCRDGGADEERL
jgi:hypothetical protein